MKMHQLPSVELLNRLFQHDEATGELFWKEDYGRARAGQLAGCMQDDGYRRIKINGVIYRAHRLIFKMVHGRDPSELDHRNGLVSDAAWNLREASRAQNNQNVRRRIDNTSGFKGVSWNRVKSKWQAMIGSEGKQKYIGIFDTKEQAYAAYCDAAKRLHGEFARLQ